MDAFALFLSHVLLASLRIAPTLVFSPPFTYLRIPVSARLIVTMGLAAWMASSHPPPIQLADGDPGWLAASAGSELLLGVALSLALQLAFAALLTAGRALDFQVGFGLAVLADPSLRNQMPLIGSLLAYAAAALFFTTTGPGDLLAIWGRSLDISPIGAYQGPTDLTFLGAYISAVFAIAFGLGGVVFISLFLVDMTVAYMSRTLPQMNVLVLGFQIKTITLLLTLPLVFAWSGSTFLRIVRLALQSTPTFAGP